MGILDWIFPRECLGCGKSGVTLCFSCKKHLLPHPELCPSCHVMSPWGRFCKNCQQTGAWALEWILIWFVYQGWLKKLLLKLKFYHKKDIGHFLAERLALVIECHEILRRQKEAKNLIFTFVPSHWYRHYFQKGYNQSQVLSQLVASSLGCSLLTLTKKVRATLSQLKLWRQERLTNLQTAFISQGLEKVPEGACVVIVDDVTTTGASLNEVAKVIKFVRKDIQIWGLVVARQM